MSTREWIAIGLGVGGCAFWAGLFWPDLWTRFHRPVRYAIYPTLGAAIFAGLVLLGNYVILPATTFWSKATTTYKWISLGVLLLAWGVVIKLIDVLERVRWRRRHAAKKR